MLWFRQLVSLQVHHKRYKINIDDVYMSCVWGHLVGKIDFLSIY
jgi:hypothetical protein